MKKINNFIESNIKKILSVFFLSQPILDVIAAFMINILNITFTLSSIIRFIFLIFCIYYLIFLSRKKKLIIYILLLGIYITIFSLNTLISKDITALFYELKNTINTFYFPIALITLCDMIKNYKIKLYIKNFIIIYLIYLGLIIIPNITNTAFMSYSEAKTGHSGWFLSANSVGNILSILFPFIIIFITQEKKKYLYKIIIIASSLFVFLDLGTKTPLLSLIICIFFTINYYIITWFKEKKYKHILICLSATTMLLLTCYMLIPKTSFYKNIQIHKEYLGIKNYSEILKDYKLIDHFIFSQRLSFLNKTAKNYDNSNIISKSFGIGYIENYSTDLVNTKTIEIDYFDILYRHGFIGFTLFFSALPLINSRKKYNNTLINCEINTSIILITLLAFFTGHIITSPSVSIFTILTIICYQGGLYEKNYKR